jgi:N-formylglutamate deformylase
MDLVTWLEPDHQQLPIVLSVPHAGTFFPSEIRDQIDSQQLATLTDTDWYVDRLYSFASAIGIPLLRANYHRWVIDLNRSPDQQPLYADGRLITGLCPTTNFLGHPIYADGRTALSARETATRTENYFVPYHEALRARLESVRQQFGVVLLWDCHSIKRHVPTIHAAPFPDLILGSADGTAASPALIETALRHLQQSRFVTAHNFPFKGGYITRTYGRPDRQCHALQLEMPKDNYLDDSETHYDERRAAEMANLLKRTLLELADVLLTHTKAR